ALVVGASVALGVGGKAGVGVSIGAAVARNLIGWDMSADHTAVGPVAATNGFQVMVGPGYTGGGTPGTVYKFIGGSTDTEIHHLYLNSEDYSTGQWTPVAPADASFAYTAVGKTTLATNDRVELPHGYTGKGTPGTVYQYLGSAGSFDLAKEDYGDTLRWKAVESTPAQVQATVSDSSIDAAGDLTQTATADRRINALI